MTITLCILGFGVVTGGAVNPARTIGPAVAAGLYERSRFTLPPSWWVRSIAGALYRWFWVQRRTLGACAVPGGAPAE